MPRLIRLLIALGCFVGFAFIRFRENDLFYDPLLSFFKGFYQDTPLPELDSSKLLFHIGLRYGIHMLLSLLILWVAFLEKGILKFASIVYAVVFVVLLLILGYLIQTYQIGQASSLFYVRRFLIQPLLIFVLLPAFFYYRKVNS